MSYEELVFAYRDGRAAYRAGVSLDENPYPRKSDTWAAWRNGWMLECCDARKRGENQCPRLRKGEGTVIYQCQGRKGHRHDHLFGDGTMEKD